MMLIYTEEISCNKQQLKKILKYHFCNKNENVRLSFGGEYLDTHHSFTHLYIDIIRMLLFLQ